MSIEPNRSLASYALALLHGVELDSFERDHLIEIAAKVGATVGPQHIDAEKRRAAARIAHDRGHARLKALEFSRLPWWRKLWS